ncbi:hypothetical protein AMTRI_Chr03g145750 [Amborella trichopoda]
MCATIRETRNGSLGGGGPVTSLITMLLIGGSLSVGGLSQAYTMALNGS